MHLIAIGTSTILDGAWPQIQIGPWSPSSAFCGWEEREEGRRVRVATGLIWEIKLLSFLNFQG